MAFFATGAFNRTMVMTSKINIVAAGLLLLTGFRSDVCASEEARQQALDYCRRSSQSIQLSEDKSVLCFDGFIAQKPDMTPFRDLRHDGYFVVRSPGGFLEPAVDISNMLRVKTAEVVIYDYCLSACANYFFVASSQTYVSERTIVAWHGGPSIPDCSYLSAGNPRERSSTATEVNELCRLGRMHLDFFSERKIDSEFVYHPQSPYTRKMAALIAQGTGYLDRSVYWMWNPRYYRAHFKTPVIAYSSYPGDELEVQQILEKWQLSSVRRLIYDP